MELAAREELAKAWLEHYTAVENKADFTAMAREQWTLNKERYRSEDLVDVTHILVGTETRSDEEALSIAQNLAAEIAADPAVFDALVLEYSDDPSAGSNKGSFRNIKKGDMVPRFEEKAFSMKVGEISDPVLTPYGYHLIRLDKTSPARQKSFAEVRVQLEEQAREKHRERIQTQYLTEIYKPELQVTKESMENALERVFGPEILAKYADSPETE
jgi:peptidyl-prolyl cis-trans isomerase C